MEKKNLGEVLKEKIEQDAKIDVTIPEFGETYELSPVISEYENVVTTQENVQENIQGDIQRDIQGKVSELVKLISKTERKEKYPVTSVRRELIGRLEKIKDEMKDMDTYVRQDIADENLRDEDIFRINEKIKDLEKQIINVIEG